MHALCILCKYCTFCVSTVYISTVSDDIPLSDGYWPCPMPYSAIYMHWTYSYWIDIDMTWPVLYCIVECNRDVRLIWFAFICKAVLNLHCMNNIWLLLYARHFWLTLSTMYSEYPQYVLISSHQMPHHSFLSFIVSFFFVSFYIYFFLSLSLSSFVSSFVLQYCNLLTRHCVFLSRRLSKPAFPNQLTLVWYLSDNRTK